MPAVDIKHSTTIYKVHAAKLEVLHAAEELLKIGPANLGVKQGAYEAFQSLYQQANANKSADSVLYHRQTELERQLKVLSTSQIKWQHSLEAKRRELKKTLDDLYGETSNTRRILFRVGMGVLAVGTLASIALFPPAFIFALMMSAVCTYLAFYPPQFDFFRDFSLSAYGVSQAEYKVKTAAPPEALDEIARHVDAAPSVSSDDKSSYSSGQRFFDTTTPEPADEPPENQVRDERSPSQEP